MNKTINLTYEEVSDNQEGKASWVSAHKQLKSVYPD